MEFVYSVEDLTNIHWLGDKDLHLFRHKWNEVTESMSDKLSQDTLAHLLVKKLDASIELKGGLDHYWRMPIGHEDHSYQFLRSAIDRCLARRQEKKNRYEQSRSLHGRTREGGVAAPAKKTTIAW